jgi:hypothetical protein
MFDLFFNDQVTVRRATAVSGTKKFTYEQVVDSEGGQLRLDVIADYNTRFLRGAENDSVQVDGTIVFRADAEPKVFKNDLVVNAAGEVFRVETLNKQPSRFGAGDYAKATLVRTRVQAPKDQEDGQ